MEQITINLDGKDFILRQSFRALTEFEHLTGKNAYEVNASISDSLNIFYCMLKACNRNSFNYSYDEFIDLLDESPTQLATFNEFLMSLVKETAVAPKKKVETR